MRSVFSHGLFLKKNSGIFFFAYNHEPELKYDYYHNSFSLIRYSFWFSSKDT